MILILSSFLWLVFFITHSYFADNHVKKSLIERFNWNEQNYRFIYSLLSLILFASVYVVQIIDSKTMLLKGMNRLPFIGIGLILNGLIFNLLAFKNISVREFIGLSSRKIIVNELIQRGVYTIVRHPFYTGLISLFIGVFLYQPTLYNALNFGAIIIYLPIGIYLEERKLIELYGSAYLDYRKKVKAVIPFLI